MEKKTVKVNILGNDYALKSDIDPQYLTELAAYVDQKMRKLGDSTSIKSQLKIAVLTTLNIADELFRLKSKQEKLIKEIESTSEEISESIDKYLNPYSDILK